MLAVGILIMSDISTIVRRHVDAAVAEAGEQGFPAETVARTMLSFVLAIYRQERDIADIRSELENVIENLDPDGEYTFMRP